MAGRWCLEKRILQIVAGIGRKLKTDLVIEWVGPVFLVALATFFHLQTLFFDSTWFFQDTGFYYYPLKIVSVDALSCGVMPFWMSRADFGVPLFGNLTLGHCYPTTVLYFIFDRITALNIEIYLHHVLAMLAVYFLCLSILRKKAAAFLGAVSFGFSGVIVSYFHNPFYLYSAAWTPLSFLALYRLILRPTVRGMAVAGLILALQFLAGDPQSLLFSGFFAFSCPLVLRSGKIRAALSSAAAAVLAFGLVAFQAMPALETFGLTHRSGGLGAGEGLIWSLHPVRFVTLVLPYFWGRLFPVNTYWGRHLVNSVNPDRFWAHSIYFGIIPLLLALYGGWIALKKDGREKRPFFLAGLLFWFFSLGIFTPVLQGVGKLIPFIHIFRYPEKYTTPAVLCLSVLAAYGFSSILSKFGRKGVARSGSGAPDPERRRASPGPAASALFPVSGVVLLAAGLGIILFRNRIAGLVAARAVLPNVQPAADHIVHQAVILTGIAVCCLVIALLLKRRALKTAAVFLLVLATADTWQASSGLRWSAHRALFELEPTGLRIFETATGRDASDLRIVVDRAPPGGRGAPANLLGARLEAGYLRNRLWPNAGVSHGARLAGGYSGAALPMSTEIMDLLFEFPSALGARLNAGMFLTRKDRPNPVIVSSLREGLLLHPELPGRLATEAESMNILAAIVPAPWERLHLAAGWEFLEEAEGFPDSRLRRALERERKSVVRDNLHVSGLEALVGTTEVIIDGVIHDFAVMEERGAPPREATVDSSFSKENYPGVIRDVQFGQSGFVKARVNTTGPGMLVLAERFFPGWRCRADGEDLPVYRVNGLSLGVFPPVGSCEVQFSYEPLNWKKGLLISVISFALLIVCFIKNIGKGYGGNADSPKGDLHSSK